MLEACQCYCKKNRYRLFSVAVERAHREHTVMSPSSVRVTTDNKQTRRTDHPRRYLGLHSYVWPRLTSVITWAKIWRKARVRRSPLVEIVICDTARSAETSHGRNERRLSRERGLDFTVRCFVPSKALLTCDLLPNHVACTYLNSQTLISVNAYSSDGHYS